MFHGPPLLREGEAETKLRSIHEFEGSGGRAHGSSSMANSRRSIESKHGTLLRLGEDNSTVIMSCQWGGSIEAICIQPTGTLSDGREALLRMGLALANLSRLRKGIRIRSSLKARALTGEGG